MQRNLLYFKDNKTKPITVFVPTCYVVILICVSLTTRFSVHSQYYVFVFADSKKSKWPFSRRSTVGVLSACEVCGWSVPVVCLWFVLMAFVSAVGFRFGHCSLTHFPKQINVVPLSPFVIGQHLKCRTRAKPIWFGF